MDEIDMTSSVIEFKIDLGFMYGLGTFILSGDKLRAFYQKNVFI